MASRPDQPPATAPDGRPRGRPRSENARIAILEAAEELLLGRGLSEVSMDAVAARAGVSKATIYRWWPTKEALALDTLYHAWDTAPLTMPDTGSLRHDLLRYLRRWTRRARRRPFGRVITELLVAVHSDPGFCARYQSSFVEPRRAPVKAMFERAIERGEIPLIDVELGLDLVFGPIFHRLLHLHSSLDDRFVEQVVDAALQGLVRTTDSSGEGERS